MKNGIAPIKILLLLSLELCINYFNKKKKNFNKVSTNELKIKTNENNIKNNINNMN